MRNSFTWIARGLSMCIVLLITSCGQFSDIDEIEDVEFQAEYAVPIINSVSTLADLLDSSGEDLSQLVTDESGNYTFFYEDEGPEKSSQELFENLPSFPFILIDTAVSVPVQFYENITVQQMDMKSGAIQFEFISQYTEDIRVEVHLPQFSKNGLPFQYVYNIVYDGNAPRQVSTPSISLAGYQLNMQSGQLDMRYVATTPSGQRVKLSVVGGEANDWVYESMQGVWHTDEFGLTIDTLDIDVFEEKFAGEVSFADPKLTLILENSFGFPVMAQVNTLKMIDEFGEVLELESSLFDDGLFLDYPSTNEMNQSKTTTITFDRNNSNIVALLNSQPQKVIYDLAVVINPNNETNPGFVTTESKIKTTIKTEVPVYGTLSNLEVEEIVESDLTDADELTHAEFKLITDNGLPFDANLQFYFLDQNEEIVDSLFTTDLHPLNAATVDSDGNVSQTSRMVSTIPIPADRMDLIKSSTNMMMKASMSTSNDATIPVRINRQQTLEVQLGAIVGVKK